MIAGIPIAGAPVADELDRCVRCSRRLTTDIRCGPAEVCHDCAQVLGWEQPHF